MCQCNKRVAAVWALLQISFLASCSTVSAQTWRVTFHGGDDDSAEIPIVAVLKDGLPTGLYTLDAGDEAKALAAQVFEEGGKRFLALVLPRKDAHRSARYSLKRQAARAADLQSLKTQSSNGFEPEGISFRAQGPNIAVGLDQKPLTVYHVDAGNKPFFFPLIGPSGHSMTRAYPMQVVDGEDHDHRHQRSCWFTHGSVNGVDFWGEEKNSGMIREVKRTIVVEGPSLGRLSTTNDWRPPGGKRVCQDERITTFYCTHDARLIDFEIKIVASDGPVTFGDTKEGMFGIRVASSMDVLKESGGKIMNAQGLTDLKAWGQASAWVDYVGPVEKITAGIAIFNHPDSFRYPTTWHVRPYGLFAANPFGWHDFGRPASGEHTVAAGQSITFRYRVILHRGGIDSSALDQRFRSYAHPPTVDIETE
jgi:Methane oxygenase PmoA